MSRHPLDGRWFARVIILGVLLGLLVALIAGPQP